MYTVETLQKSISSLPLGTVNTIVNDIAKKTKKKRLASGNLSYEGYCKVIAENLLKEGNKAILEKHVQSLS